MSSGPVYGILFCLDKWSVFSVSRRAAVHSVLVRRKTDPGASFRVVQSSMLSRVCGESALLRVQGSHSHYDCIHGDSSVYGHSP
jgi:hypothetical protein